MPVYFLVGPAAAIIGVVAVFFVMRNRSTQKKSMYSSRRGQIERKVQAARARTLAPRGRGQKQTTSSAISAVAPAPPAYQPPAAPARQAWEAPAAPPPAYNPPAAPAYEPPPASAFEPAPSGAEPAAQPEWATPAPGGEQAWTPAPAPAPDFSTPAPAQPAVSAPEPASSPAGGGASWEVVGGEAPAAEPAAPSRDKGKKEKEKESEQPTGGAWSLASGGAPSETEDGEEELARKPSAAMALAQYAVLVVGLVMVLIGVLVMVANAKVT